MQPGSLQGQEKESARLAREVRVHEMQEGSAAVVEPMPAEPPPIGSVAAPRLAAAAQPLNMPSDYRDAPTRPKARLPPNKPDSKLDSHVYPPENFCMVSRGIYRGSFPPKKSLAFMEKLGLKSIVYLCPEEPPAYYLEFMRQNNVQFLHHGLKGNKEPFVQIPEVLVAKALAQIVVEANQPVYIHCDKGKHRTGCVVGCLRRIQNWSRVSIFAEYTRHAGLKGRTFDLQFIELFGVQQVVELLGGHAAAAEVVRLGPV